MAVRNSQPAPDLVMLTFGWYGKYLMPIDAANTITAQLVKSGAVKVEQDTVASVSILRPTELEFDMQPLKGPFLSDCPKDQDLRKDYFAWLTTKRDLIGSEYQFESYSDYLRSKS